MYKNSSFKVGIIGWRGMVGQVLLERFNATNGLINQAIFLFSSQTIDATSISLNAKTVSLERSDDIIALGQCEILISCQGSAYTQRMLPMLRQQGWQGYWLDAASHLRLDPKALLVLDPINQAAIELALLNDQKTFVGPNCCTSLLLLALQGLYDKNIIQHTDTHTYQAISGAGSTQLKNYLMQICAASDIIGLDDIIHTCHQLEQSNHTLLNNVIPWVDALSDHGATKEELKFAREATKLHNKETPISATCVRVNALRCHSQSVTLTLNKNYPLDDIKHWLAHGNAWTKLIDDDAPELLSPKPISNTLDVAVGRIRQDAYRPNVIHLFTIGDQLLWGAAEPLVRTCQMILTHLNQALGTKTDQVDCVK